MERNNKKIKTISLITIVLFAVAAFLDFLLGDYALTVVFAIAAVLDYHFVLKKYSDKDSESENIDSEDNNVSEGDKDSE